MTNSCTILDKSSLKSNRTPSINFISRTVIYFLVSTVAARLRAGSTAETTACSRVGLAASAGAGSTVPVAAGRRLAQRPRHRGQCLGLARRARRRLARRLVLLWRTICTRDELAFQRLRFLLHSCTIDREATRRLPGMLPSWPLPSSKETTS